VKGDYIRPLIGISRIYVSTGFDAEGVEAKRNDAKENYRGNETY
jgi:hypothetical protein